MDDYGNLSISIAPTYGTITYEGVEIISKALCLTPNDVFYDLGSGIGSLCTQIFMNTPVKKVVGIEYLKDRHEEAVRIKQKIESVYPERFEQNRSIVFECADFTQCDWNTATVILACSTCYDKSVLERIVKKVNDLQSVRYVISQRMLFDDHLEIVNILQLPCSWYKACNFNIYKCTTNSV